MESKNDSNMDKQVRRRFRRETPAERPLGGSRLIPTPNVGTAKIDSWNA